MLQQFKTLQNKKHFLSLILNNTRSFCQENNNNNNKDNQSSPNPGFSSLPPAQTQPDQKYNFDQIKPINQIQYCNSFEDLGQIIQNEEDDNIGADFLGQAYQRVQQIQAGGKAHIETKGINEVMDLLCSKTNGEYIGQMSLTHLSCTLTAITDTGHKNSRLGNSVYNDAMELANDRLEQFKGAQLAREVFQAAGAAKVDDVLLVKIARILLRDLGSLQQAEVAQSLWTLAKQEKYSEGMFDKLLKQASRNMKKMKGTDLALIMWACSRVRHMNSYFFDKMCDHLCEAGVEKLQFTPKNAADMLTGMGDLNYVHTETLMQLSEVLTQTDNLDLSDIVQSIKSWTFLNQPLYLLNDCLESAVKLFESTEITVETEKQLYNFYFAYSLCRAREQKFQAPEELLNLSQRCWEKFETNRQRPNYHQYRVNEIKRALDQLRIKSQTDQFLENPLIRTDVTARVGAERVAIFPLHVRDYTATKPYYKMGKTAAMQYLYESQGYKVIDIPFFDWKQKRIFHFKMEYLKGKIHFFLNPPKSPAKKKFELYFRRTPMKRDTRFRSLWAAMRFTAPNWNRSWNKKFVRRELWKLD
eukprot:TRINITY_DN12151_c0_g4_i2.p1 TRINITY_DN12151_c0_g4~~TRINITY_DN12151_c0_g4_i2.p1  ORF type:complete len:593 (-),score=63.02 TRINITY_DN12151_c0_g4_i2:403-2154(-)